MENVDEAPGGPRNVTARETDTWASTQAIRDTPAGRRSHKYRAVTLVAIVLIAAMAVYFLARREEVAYFRRLSLGVVLLTLVFQFVSQLLWNGAMLLPLRTYMKLGYWELFVVRAGGVLASYGVPVAGNIGVRLAYLRRRGLDYSQFAWATITSNVLGLAGAGALGLIALGMLWMRAGSVPVPVVALSAAVSLLALGGLAALGFLPRLAGHTRFQKWPWLSRMSGHEIDRRTIVSVVVFSFGRHGFNFLSFGLLYQALLQTPGQFLNGGLVYAITTPIRIVSITPGNLGINEWVTAAVGMMLSFDVTTGLIVALMFRVLSFAAQALGGLSAAAWLALRSGK